MKKTLVILFCMFCYGNVNAQDICETMLSSDMEKLEVKLSQLENENGDIEEFTRDLEEATKQLEACADNTDGDLSAQRSKLAELKKLFEEKSNKFTASSPIDAKRFYNQFMTVDYKVRNFPGGSFREQFNPAIVNRKNLEFFLTYDSHPYEFETIDQKNIYEGLVTRIQDQYKLALASFNSDKWASTFDYYLKSAKETKDMDAKKNGLRNMENDLLLWQELLFPNSKKLKGCLQQVRDAQ